MSDLLIILGGVALFVLACFVCTWFSTTKSPSIEDLTVKLEEKGFKVGQWYVYTSNESKYIFIPLEIDTLGINVFISGNNLNGGMVYYSSVENLPLRENCVDINEQDIFNK